MLTPYEFGLQMGKQAVDWSRGGQAPAAAKKRTEKQAFMGELLNKTLGSARSAVGAIPGALKTYGKRMMGGSTLKPLQQRANMINDLGYTMFQPPWIDDARSIGNPDSIAKLRNTWQHGVMNNGPHGRPSWPSRALNFGAANDPVHKNLEDTAYKYLERHQEDALQAITKERAAINAVRDLTAGGTAVGAIGAAGLGARHAANAMSKESLVPANPAAITRKSRGAF